MPRLLVPLVLLAALVPRAFDLSSDPPTLFPNVDAWGDEGAWNYAPAYAAQTGAWPDWGRRFQDSAPLYANAQRLVFSLAGPGLVQARLLSSVSGVLNVALVGVLLLPLGALWALTGMALYGSSFWVITVDRLAMPEPLVTVFLAVAMILAARGRQGGRASAAGALLCCAAAFLAKPPAVFGVVAIAGFVAWDARPTGDRRHGFLVGRHRGLLLALLAVGSACLALSSAARAFIRTGVVDPFLMLNASASPGEVVRSRALLFAALPLNYPFFVHMAPMMAGAGLLIGFPPRARPDHALSRRIATLSILWLLCWWFFTPFMGPPHYRFSFLPLPLTALGVLGYRRALEWRGAGEPVIRSTTRRVTIGAFCLWYAYMWSMWLSDTLGVQARYWLLLLVGLSALWVAAHRLRSRSRGGAWVARRSPVTVIGALVVGTVLCEAYLFVDWASDRTHYLAEAQRAVTGLGLNGQAVCGKESMALFVGDPEAARPYYWLVGHGESRGCVVDGSPADLVLVGAEPQCAAASSDFVRLHYATLLALPHLAELRLPGSPSGREDSCRFFLTPLPPSLLDPAP